MINKINVILWDYSARHLEKKLVDKLVGNGFVRNIGLSKLGIGMGGEYQLHHQIKEVWKNGRTCEEIQAKYDEVLEKFLNKKGKSHLITPEQQKELMIKSQS